MLFCADYAKINKVCTQDLRRCGTVGSLKDYFDSFIYPYMYSACCVGIDAGGQVRGTGAISGAAETYWGKNKGRSMEGLLVKLTKLLAALFMILAVILNLNVF